MNMSEYSNNIRLELKQEIKGCIIRPSVAVIYVGTDLISEYYNNLMEEACNFVGMYYRYYKFDDTTPELTIINKIKELNNDDYVNGIVVQLPLPQKYNDKKIINTIINSKDVFGITDINLGRLINGRKTIVSPYAMGVETLLNENNISIQGKNICVIGKGRYVGKPLIATLVNNGATVSICHSKTLNLNDYIKNSDIVINASNCKDVFDTKLLKKDTILINCGVTLDNDKVIPCIKSDNLYNDDSLLELAMSLFLKNILLSYKNKN